MLQCVLRAIRMISSLTSALLSADVFGKNSLPSGPAALKANESLNTWLLAKKAPDGKTDIKNAGGYMKYICGTTADAAVKTTKSPSLCVPETNDIDVSERIHEFPVKFSFCQEFLTLMTKFDFKFALYTHD